ncbi:MAG TPA: hypothetical protein VFM05_03995, partial [Candidatus Saccharimonadales bacterium]|nr:hypothetical protein [Candidatus Saccharimonadales bacterium]
LFPSRNGVYWHPNRILKLRLFVVTIGSSEDIHSPIDRVSIQCAFSFCGQGEKFRDRECREQQCSGTSV